MRHLCFISSEDITKAGETDASEFDLAFTTTMLALYAICGVTQDQ